MLHNLKIYELVMRSFLQYVLSNNNKMCINFCVCGYTNLLFLCLFANTIDHNTSIWGEPEWAQHLLDEQVLWRLSEYALINIHSACHTR